MSQKYIFAVKDDGSKYYAEHLVEDLDRKLWNLEYGDVKASEYQIWEYPSGKISVVVADRNTLADDNYSTPDPNIWLPELRLLYTDIELVNKEYKRLSS